MIVHLTDVFAPRVGGIEIHVESLARAQVATGDDVCVITAVAAREGHDGQFPFPVHRVTGAQQLRGLLLALRPAVAHVHMSVFSPFALAAARLGRRLGIPVVLTVHSMWDLPVRWCYRSIGMIERWRERLVVTSVSTAVAHQVERALPGVRNVVVASGIAPEQWRVTARSSGDLHVVSVGRLAFRRRPLLLLKVLRGVHDRLAGEVTMRVTVVGAGALHGVMQWYLRRHGMTDWVWLAGPRDRRGVLDVLATADVYLNVTRREAFGLAALEARTAGVPVIARTGTGVRDFIEHGREGLLARTTEDLVAALAWMARDHRMRGRIAAHNRTVAPAACSWPIIIDRLRQCYAIARQTSRASDLTRPAEMAAA